MVQKLRLHPLNKGPNMMDVPLTPPDVQESSAFESGWKRYWAIGVSTLWGRELCFGSRQLVTQLLGLCIGVAQRCPDLSEGSA